MLSANVQKWGWISANHTVQPLDCQSPSLLTFLPSSPLHGLRQKDRSFLLPLPHAVERGDEAPLPNPLFDK